MEFPPFSTIQVHGVTKVKGHDKKVNLIVERMKNTPNKKIVWKIDSSGIKDWSEEDQKEIKKTDQGLWLSICSKWPRLRKTHYCETYYQTYKLYSFQRKILQNTTTSVWGS